MPPQGDSSSNTTISAVDLFNSYLPYYLAIGMSYDLYWNGDYEAVKYYRQADKIKTNRENEKLWLQGLYIYEAICKASPLFNLFSKDRKPLPYAEQPYPLTRKDSENKEEIKQRNNAENIKTKMEAFAKAFNKKFEQKKIEEKHDTRQFRD